MEAMVIGENALKNSMNYIKKFKNENDLEFPSFEINDGSNSETVSKLKKELQAVMWNDVGIVRKENQLWDALTKINVLNMEFKKIKGINKEIVELRNMFIVGKEIIRSAIKRKQSVGCHIIENN